MYSILIADDEEIVRKGLVSRLEFLRLAPSSLYEAGNGKEALKLIKDKQPDIVITDIRMPMMDGLQLIEQTQSLYPDIQFIVLSGFAEFEYAKKAMKFGVKAYLLKPLSNEDLRCAIEDAVFMLQKTKVLMSRLNGNAAKINGEDYRTRIFAAIDYIKSHYTECLRVDSLASQFAFSANYFSNLFKKETGKTLMKYITKLRIEKACFLLQTTDLSIFDIAQRAGYTDSQYFFRVFKKITKTSPQKYRKTCARA